MPDVDSHSGDRGSALVLTLLLGLGLVGGALLALPRVLVDLVERQHARSAADAAALAGVTGGEQLAGAIARANGGALVGWSHDGHRVTVTVQVGDQQVSASATDEP